jgi:hypothetical protein
MIFSIFEGNTIFALAYITLREKKSERLLNESLGCLARFRRKVDNVSIALTRCTGDAPTRRGAI